MSQSFHGLARESLLAYAIANKPGYMVGHHHRQLAHALELVEAGKLDRLIVNMPPRHGKSELASRLFPAWFLGRNPHKQIIAATYAQDLAEDLGQDVRDLSDSLMHRAIFPGTGLRRDSRAKAKFKTLGGGVYYGTGVGGPIAGKGAHVALVDDPLKNRVEAESEIKRKIVKRWYASDLYTRLLPGASAIVVVQTRWHDDDLAGWLLKQHAAEGWVTISLPAIAEEDEGWRPAGAALWPEAYPLERLARIKAALEAEEGPRAWLSLYQQRPVAAEGLMMNRAWWRRWKDIPANATDWLQSWDCTFKDGDGTDYVVGQVWCRVGAEYYLVDQVRGRMSFTATCQAIRDLSKKWPRARLKLIEDKANGPAVIDSLQRTLGGIVAVNPEGGKLARVNSVLPAIEARNVWIPDDEPWALDFIEEAASFPAGKHDDQVDAMSQALIRLRGDSAARTLAALGRM